MGVNILDDKQLSYFISVADHLNFTKAAQHHYISQTAMSQQIMALEQQLGVKLFNRNNRSVELTTAGKVFYDEAKFIVAKTKEAIEKAQRAFSGVEGNLVIGFVGPYEKGFLPMLLKSFSSLYPTIHLSLVKTSMDNVGENLVHGVIDVAFVPKFGLQLSEDIQFESILKYPQCIVLYPGHFLANRRKIRRSEVAHEKFITAAQTKAPLAYNTMIQDCAKHGFSPNIIHQPPSLETVLLMVEAEIGIALMPLCYRTYASKNLRFIELEGEDEHVELIAAWKDNNHNPSIPLFIEVLNEHKETF
jgi:DNA-binding transcriptional LysR family regulator